MGEHGLGPPFRVIFPWVEYNYNCSTYATFETVESIGTSSFPGFLDGARSGHRANAVSAAGVGILERTHFGEDVRTRSARAPRDIRRRFRTSTRLRWIASLSSTGRSG